MALTGKSQYQNWTGIIRRPGLAETIPSGSMRSKIMFEKIEAERLIFETESADISRWEEDGGRCIQVDRSTPDQTRRNPLERKVGMWLDRNKAVIVSVSDKTTGRKIITSDMEHYVLYSTIVPGDGSPEEIRDRRFWNHLGEYYDKIIAHIRDAGEIQLFGPDVAKYELERHLEVAGLAGYIVSIGNAEKMTDIQIAERVLKRFPLRARFDLS